MNHTKQEELARLQARYPTFSPFVLLKLSMIRYGAVLTLQCAGEDSRFHLRFLLGQRF
ncbi:hypothetical protein [Fournierella massiliensis]|uniref:hypothetical protein n=1 Tax=Allofournierella massiliensis TaxID=1650663 RepID=UPI003522376E